MATSGDRSRPDHMIEKTPAKSASRDTLTREFGSDAPSMEAWLSAIVESSDDAIISKTTNGIITSWNKGAEHLFGFSAAEAVGRPITIIIPEDRLHEEETILRNIRQGIAVQHFETVRLRKDGSLVDISLTVSPVRDDQGRVVGASKVARDISERKRLAMQQALLLREMSHRVKNIFAIMSTLVSLSERGTTSVKEFSNDMRARIGALAAANSLVLQQGESNRDGDNSISLFALIRQLFAAHQEHGRERISIRGHDVSIRDSVLTSLALLLHEFATNAIKYGSLSVPAGSVEIDIHCDSELTLTWIEIGGPPVHPPEGAEGFGSHLERMTVQALKGSIDRVWNPAGLRITLRLPLLSL